MLRRNPLAALYSTLAAVTCAAILFPLVWALLFSFKTSADFFGSKLIPFAQFKPTLANWRLEWDAFRDQAGLGHEVKNSLLVATGATVLSLLIGVLAAYGLLLRRLAGHRIWPIIFFCLVPRIVPSIVVALPYTQLMRDAGLHDTLTALVIAHTTLALPYVIPLLYVTFLDLPSDVVVAAELDGARGLTVIRDIVVPLSLPILLTVAVLSFALSWSELIFALTNSQRFADTAPLSIIGLDAREGVQFEYVGSHLVIVLLPPLLLAFAARRFVVRGLTFGAVREGNAGAKGVALRG